LGFWPCQSVFSVVVLHVLSCASWGSSAFDLAVASLFVRLARAAPCLLVSRSCSPSRCCALPASLLPFVMLYVTPSSLRSTWSALLACGSFLVRALPFRAFRTLPSSGVSVFGHFLCSSLALSSRKERNSLMIQRGDPPPPR